MGVGVGNQWAQRGIFRGLRSYGESPKEWTQKLSMVQSFWAHRSMIVFFFVGTCTHQLLFD